MSERNCVCEKEKERVRRKEREGKRESEREGKREREFNLRHISFLPSCSKTCLTNN